MPDIHDRRKRDRNFRAWVWRAIAVVVALETAAIVWLAMKVFG